ncbi:hypothetical protein AB0L65_06345 [Nonomuraea sp. NPDC052116]|uniref:hypothetical protein n=1 Tax=Nonomuraea sp. NPDC052116 TaxID=3155665 RepID=UPI00342F66FC
MGEPQHRGDLPAVQALPRDQHEQFAVVVGKRRERPGDRVPLDAVVGEIAVDVGHLRIEVPVPRPVAQRAARWSAGTLRATP